MYTNSIEIACKVNKKINNFQQKSKKNAKKRVFLNKNEGFIP